MTAQRELAALTRPPAMATERAARASNVLFNNVPSFDHLPAAKRKLALQTHRGFEALMSDTPDGILHYAVTPPHGYGVPRQQLAHLIVKYCQRWHTHLNELLDSITKANGDISDAALLRSRPSDHKAIVNLLALPDDVLWRVYCEIPVDCRPPERPKIERDPNAPPPKKKRRVRMDGTIIMPKRPAPAPAPELAPVLAPVFSDVCWVCCDLCKKWRRIPGKQEDLPDRWACIDHPDKITCDTPEEAMEDDEKWDGATHGREGEPCEGEPCEEACEEASTEDGDSQVDESELWGDEDGDES